MACGSNPSRAPTSTSIALWTSTPAAVWTECSNGGSSPFEPGGEAALAATELVEGFLPEPERLPELELARRSPRSGRRAAAGDPRRRPAAPWCRSAGRGSVAAGRSGASHHGRHRDRHDRAPRRHPSSAGRPRAPGIAGALAGGDAAAATLAESLALPLDRVRRHLTRLAAAGVARLQPDRRTYRLDPETLRWAAEQVGTASRGGHRPRRGERGRGSGAPDLLPRRAPHGGADEGVETPDRPRARSRWSSSPVAATTSAR